MTGVAEVQQEPAEDGHEDRHNAKNDLNRPQHRLFIDLKLFRYLVDDILRCCQPYEPAEQTHESGDHWGPAQEKDQPGRQREHRFLIDLLVGGQPVAPCDPQHESHVSQGQKNPGRHEPKGQTGVPTQDRPQPQQNQE